MYNNTSANNNLEQRRADFKNFVKDDYAGFQKYVNTGNQSDLESLARIAATASAVDQRRPGGSTNLIRTGMVYNAYDQGNNNNRGGSSRKMRSYRNKSNKRNKRNKRTGRTRRGKRRLH